jgi:uncharacterized membrane protein
MTKFLWLMLCMFQVGCNYSLSKTPLIFSEGQGQLDQIPAGAIVSYEVAAKAIISPRCLECHSRAGGDADGINLETYENVTANLDIIKSAVLSDSMPKNRAKLSTKEKQILIAWIDAGAPLDGKPISTPSPTPIPVPPVPVPPTPDSETVTYQMVKTAVIIPRCLNCHSNEGGNRGEINLESYENVAAAAPEIAKEIESGSMPRPRNKPLTSEQKTMILKWIEIGFPEK